MTLQENIKAAQVDLISELGIDKLSQDKQQALLVQIGEVMQQNVILRIVEELSEKKKKEFGKVLQENSKSPQVVEAFLTENLPNLEELVLDEIGKYKTEAKEFLARAMGQTEDVSEEKGIPKEPEQTIAPEKQEGE